MAEVAVANPGTEHQAERAELRLCHVEGVGRGAAAVWQGAGRLTFPASTARSNLPRSLF